jgi:hypothetical protein
MAIIICMIVAGEIGFVDFIAAIRHMALSFLKRCGTPLVEPGRR